MREADAERAAGTVAATDGVEGALKEEILRDLRHTVGNHFHKLFYWADRVAGEANPESRREKLAELNSSLQHFQEHLEVGLGLFEPLQACMTSMDINAIASASQGVFHDLLDGIPFDVSVEEGLAERQALVDPQQFSHALRLLVPLLGGRARGSFSCRFSGLGTGSILEIRLEAHDGEAPLEIPVLDWAVARQAILSQRGTLGRSPEQEAIGGCVITLPIVGSQER